MAMLGAACSECCNWWGFALRDWTGNCIGWNYFGRSWKRNPPGDGWSYVGLPQGSVHLDFSQDLTEEWQTVWSSGGPALGSIAWPNPNAPYGMSAITVEVRRVAQSVFLRLTIRGLVTFLTTYAATSPLVVTYEKTNESFDKDVTEFTASDIKEFQSGAAGQSEILVNWLRSHCGSIAILKKPRPPELYGKQYSFDLFFDVEEYIVPNSGNQLFPIVTAYPSALSDNPVVFDIQGDNGCAIGVELEQRCGYAATFSLPANLGFANGAFGSPGSFLFNAQFFAESQSGPALPPVCVELPSSPSPLAPNAARVMIHWVAFVAFSVNGRIATSNYDTSSLVGNTGFVFEQKNTSADTNGLLELRFASCFGKHARGYATCEIFGPITQATLRSGGVGYAKLGRSVPTLTVSNQSAEPAELTITLSQQQDACGIPYWRISSISVVDGGRGYTNDEALVIAPASGTTVEVAATGTITTESGVEEPEIEAATQSGTGADFTVAVVQPEETPERWTITQVTFVGTTSGYVDGQYVSFGGIGVVEVTPAAARIVCNRSAPAVSGTDFSLFGTGGSGAVLSYTYAQGGTEPEIYWAIDSVTIEGGGSGYDATGILFAETAIGGVSLSTAAILIDAVDENGAIQSVTLLDGGSFFSHDGTIAAVVVESGGEYYGEKSNIESIEITNGGVYYVEDASLTPYVADVTVSVVQPEGDLGEGAIIEAVVEDDTASANFGKIVSLILSAGGENYTDNLSPSCGGNPLP